MVSTIICTICNTAVWIYIYMELAASIDKKILSHLADLAIKGVGGSEKSVEKGIHFR